EIENYSGIPLRHPRRGNQQFFDFLASEVKEGTLQGFWGYGGPWVIRWILGTARLVTDRPDIQIFYVNDYSTAIREVLALLASLQPQGGGDLAEGAERTGWSYMSEGFRVTFDLLEDGTVLDRSKGHFRLVHVKPYFALLEQLLEVENPRGDGSFVQINDGAELDHLDWRAAVHYFRAAADLHRRHRCHGMVVCNAVGPVGAVSMIGHRIFPFPFVVEPDLPSARRRARELLRPSRPMQAVALPSLIPLPPLADQGVEQVVRYAGTIDWHTRGIDEPPVASDDPFAPIYHLLRVLKLDFDTILAEREAMQEQVLRASKLSALGTLTAGVSHELNSPLTAVLGDASVILEQSEDPEISRSAKRIQRCAQRMRDIIDQLSIFGRRGNGGATVDADVNECVLQAHEELDQLLDQRNVEIALDLAPELPPVRIDQGHLKTVLHNLLINASIAYEGKALPLPHPVVLSTSIVEDWVHIACADQGVGMTDEVRERAFDPFFTTRDVGQGIGLGLYICDRVVADHGGRIRLESKVGEGTTVTIELPRSPAPLPKLH
ncbi:MAG: HAMP domain-containing sensor histidine kinase, partial [Polyangia bacterium]|nr:HAMP domain-containing sensor histidine kinase [Polyangia bacterium]